MAKSPSLDCRATAACWVSGLQPEYFAQLSQYIYGRLSIYGCNVYAVTSTHAQASGLTLRSPERCLLPSRCTSRCTQP